MFAGLAVIEAASPTSPTTVTTIALRTLLIASSGSLGSVAPSRTAAMGGTMVARSAGYTLASTVIPIPRASETTIVRVSVVSPLFGSVSPAPRRRA